MKICDVCGDILRYEPIKLSMQRGTQPRSNFLYPWDEGEGWKSEEGLPKDILKKLFSIEICHNCADIVPAILKETQRRLMEQTK